MDRKRQNFNKNSKGGNKKTIWKKKDSKIVAVDHEIEQLKTKYNEVGLTDAGDNTMIERRCYRCFTVHDSMREADNEADLIGNRTRTLEP